MFGNISSKTKRKVFSLFYIFDCITYTIMLFSLFLFVSLLTSDIPGDTFFFDILIFIVTATQLLRPFIMILFKDTERFVREASLAFLFASLYFFFFQINNITPDNSIPLLFKIRTTIEIFFYSIYIIFTFPRVASFLRSIRMDFLYSFTFGFIFLIFFGTWLLSLPFSRTIDIPIIDLAFTATSAVTITGLSVIDISKDLTFLGQFILLLLIQIGGLGILTFSTLYIINLKNRLSFEERMNTAELFGTKEIKDINALLKGIVISTILIECLGAILLYIGSRDLNISPEYRIFFAIFHSVNAFCNAGFSLISSSLRYFYDNPLIMYTIATMIILGGLGFVTLLDIRKKFLSFFSSKKIKRGVKLSNQTKLVLIMSFGLIILGSIGFYTLESHNTLKNMDTTDQINNSIFQSVTSRTAGYQTLSMVNLKDATLWMMIILMFIGTAPNSTGGGLKITTLFVLIWGVLKVALHRTQSQDPLFGFNFTTQLVARAGAIVFIRISILVVAIFLMSLYEDMPLFLLIFEAVSAFSTTGLTMNTTPFLSTESKIIVIILMFVGRVGAFYILSNIIPIKEKKSNVRRNRHTLSLE